MYCEQTVPALTWRSGKPWWKAHGSVPTSGWSRRISENCRFCIRIWHCNTTTRLRNKANRKKNISYLFIQVLNFSCKIVTLMKTKMPQPTFLGGNGVVALMKLTWLFEMYEKVWSSVEYLRLFIFLALFATSFNNPSTNYLLKFNYRLFLYLLNNSH